METRDYPAIAEQYARDVVGKKIPAGKYVRLACKRHLDDLKKQRRKAFAFRFDPSKAARICKFVELLPHTKGKWARSKERIHLEPWQIFILGSVFGWLRKADGLRRFRKLFLLVPRKNGKSIIAAGIGLYMLCADDEVGAEVYSGATNEKQAWEVFKPAKLMAQRTPALQSRWGVEVNAKTVNIPGDESKFETLIGKPGDGQSPSCAIHDEYHEHPDSDQLDAMETGMGAREQPLQVIITTAGDNLAGPCWADVQDHRKVLEGVIANDELFYIEYSIDKGDDWKSEASLKKANPNFGISVSDDFLRSRQREAISTPRKAGAFKTKHLDLWVSARAAYFDVEKWRHCADDRIPVRAVDALQLPWLQGRRCKLGLDLASKIDIAALEYLFEPEGGVATRDDPFIRIGRYFVPSGKVAETPSYLGWDALNLLDVTPGDIIDYGEIELAIVEATKLFQVEHVAYDPHQATYLVTRLQAEGVPVVEYRPLVINFSEPMKELDALSKSRKIRHGGCPVMEWQVSNVVAQPDKKDNVYPTKPNEQSKIDNPVALISALGVSMNETVEQSVYESRGVRML